MSASSSTIFAGQHALPSLEGISFAHNRLQRDTEYRDESTLDAMMVQTGARFYLLDGERVLLWVKDGRSNALYCQSRAEKLGADISQAIVLGSDPEERMAPRLAVPLRADMVEALEADPDYEFWTVRAIGLKGVLPPDQQGALAQARSLMHWHANHGFCAKCGARTKVALAGARRDCPSCEAQHFPRTDPVVIMLAVHRDENGVERCLLGHHARFDGPMYSTLAGFMEQGETLEDAVRREIYEEAGVPIGAVRYLASQPWPFPSSLMLGCYAEAQDDALTLDETELTDAQWFTRAQIADMMKRPVGDPLPHVPGSFSIAAWLIRSWLEADD